MSNSIRWKCHLKVTSSINLANQNFFLGQICTDQSSNRKTHCYLFFFKAKTEAWLDVFAHLEGNQSKAVQGGRTSVTLQVSSPLVTSESAGFLNRATLLQLIAECDTRQPCERRHRWRGIICSSFHSVIRAAAGACLTSSRLQLPGVL